MEFLLQTSTFGAEANMYAVPPDSPFLGNPAQEATSPTNPEQSRQIVPLGQNELHGLPSQVFLSAGYGAACPLPWKRYVVFPMKLLAMAATSPLPLQAMPIVPIPSFVTSPGSSPDCWTSCTGSTYLSSMGDKSVVCGL